MRTPPKPDCSWVLPPVLALALAASCVTENRTTGEPIPRGNQKYAFHKVEKDAENLRLGMSKMEVMLMLGSPAEQDESGNVWVYLPERHGVLLPARALRLEFREHVLAEFDFRPIVLGARI